MENPSSKMTCPHFSTMKPGTSSRLQLLLQLLLQLGLHNLLQLLLHDFQELRLQLLTQGTRESRLGKVHRVGVDQWEQPDMFFFRIL
jgi:hypothetical protein